MTRIPVAAKINLALVVGERRGDGLHEVATVLQRIDVCDRLELGEGRELLVEGFAADTLVRAALTRLAAEAGTEPRWRVRLDKRIPVGAGLGGGSADAAAVISALNDLWQLDLDRQTLMEVAAEVGSDVPYCLAGGTGLATGRGEDVTPLPAPDNLAFVLGISDEPLLTADVYDMVDLLEPAADVGSAPMTLALGAGDGTEIAALLHNDLERAAVALRPELAQKKERLLDAGALGAALSGSGPTLFAVATDEGHARHIAARVTDEFHRVMVVTSAPLSLEALD